MIIDTAGALMHEGMEDKQPKLGGVSESKYNNGESDLVVATVNELLTDVGLTAADIGVISPYNAQVNQIKKLLFESLGETTAPKIEVSTVDGFQGREKEVIIISMVRSNPSKTIGFLSNERRMNVAVTRAKRQCILICDSGTVNKSVFLKGLTDYFKEKGLARSAFDY
mmetsp:Transcript_1108/g.1296  ORF Transcript_1108/g.1296 Transcript_1108/m.1296 type:complete len:168 (+) Transcript_1108:420-923(+)